MGQALYRKYRSKSFDDVLGQDHIVKTLKNALKSGQISHAYLFTGPKGVGKTSVARILAHEVNSLDYNDESIHLDIIEIDAASNRRIDEIRELRDRVHVAPTSAKYKVYIIDEVHMLTREAFNALLKTLEEPPAHCIFILATTEAHKLPETIVSRTQHFSFKPIEAGQAAKHLQQMAKKEKIDIDKNALELLAEHGNGSFRDSISLLDQLSGWGGEITEEQVRGLLGLPPAAAIERLVKYVRAGDSQAALKSLDELKDQGVNFTQIARAINRHLREMLLSGQSEPWVISLLRRLSAVAGSSNPQDRLEIDILDAASRNNVPSGSPPKESKKSQVPLPKTAAEPPADERVLPAESKPAVDKPKASNGNTGFDLSLWPEVTEKVKAEAASLYTALRLAEPQIAGNKLVLAFQFPLHQKKVNQAKNIDIIGKAIEQVSGVKIEVECVVDKTILTQPAADYPAEAADDNHQSASLQTISNIFGTAEMLES